MDRRTFIVGTAASAALLPHAARAQEAFPARPITILNAFPPGGINDVVTRPAATALEGIFKQPVVVETKAGAPAPGGARSKGEAGEGDVFRDRYGGTTPMMFDPDKPVDSVLNSGLWVIGTADEV